MTIRSDEAAAMLADVDSFVAKVKPFARRNRRSFRGSH
jgi:hypothetical protein